MALTGWPDSRLEQYFVLYVPAPVKLVLFFILLIFSFHYYFLCLYLPAAQQNTCTLRLHFEIMQMNCLGAECVIKMLSLQ